MTDTKEVISQMFLNLTKMRLDPQIVAKMAPVVDGLLERLQGAIDISSEEGWNRLKIARCGMLAHGWAVGMNPYNSPDENSDGDPILLTKDHCVFDAADRAPVAARLAPQG